MNKQGRGEWRTRMEERTNKELEWSKGRMENQNGGKDKNNEESGQ